MQAGNDRQAESLWICRPVGKCKMPFSLLADPITLASSSRRGAPRAFLRRRNGYSSPFARDTIFTGVGVGTFCEPDESCDAPLYPTFHSTAVFLSNFASTLLFHWPAAAPPSPYLLHSRSKLSLCYTPSPPSHYLLLQLLLTRRDKPPTCGQPRHPGQKPTRAQGPAGFTVGSACLPSLSSYELFVRRTLSVVCKSTAFPRLTERWRPHPSPQGHA
jgi:hypothetical protein